MADEYIVARELPVSARNCRIAELVDVFCVKLTVLLKFDIPAISRVPSAIIG